MTEINDVANSDTRSSQINIINEDGSELTFVERQLALHALNCFENPRMKRDEVSYNCRNVYEEKLSHERIEEILHKVEQHLNIEYAKKAAKENKNRAVEWNIEEINVQLLDDLIVIPLNEVGYSKRFVLMFGNSIRYNQDNEKWHIYDGSTWNPVHESIIQGLGTKVSDALLLEALHIKSELKDIRLKHAMETTKRSTVSSLISFSRCKVGITNKEFDNHWNKLNMANGVFDLDLPEVPFHDGGIKDEYHSIKMPVKYDPDAKCPEWEAHIKLIMKNDFDMIQTLQISLGYSLLGKFSEYFFIPYGTGRNGKGITLQTIAKILGSYASCVDVKTVISTYNDKGIREDIAGLKGKRFVYVEEPDKVARLDTAFIKKVTGGGEVSAAFKYGHEFKFEPQFALWLNTNHQPKVNETTTAIKDRVRMFPFTYTVPISERKDPVELVNYFVDEEGPGIFNWLINGLKLYYDNNSKIPFCEKVMEASEDMIFSNDILGRCIKDIAIYGDDEMVNKDLFFHGVTAWLTENDEELGKPGEQLTKKALAGLMGDRGFSKKENVFGPGRVWRGIRLKTKEEVENGITQLPTDNPQMAS